ncbi:hypothetical protein HDU96_003759 [Phlyctochytrium bullatum]|nr:hypothetical protein HDU96_003759 [Phlyctochytrium bullatum]
MVPLAGMKTIINVAYSYQIGEGFARLGTVPAKNGENPEIWPRIQTNSRLWRDVQFEQLASILTCQATSPFSSFTRLFSIGKHVRQVTLKITSDNAFQSFAQVGCWTVLQACSNLQRLKISRTGGASPHARVHDALAIQTILQSAPPSTGGLSLKIKHLPEEALLQGTKSLLNLTELSLSCVSVGEAGLEGTLAAAGVGMRKVSLQGDWINERCVRAVAGLAGLQELALISRGGIRPAWLADLPERSFPALRRLVMDGTPEEDCTTPPQWPQALDTLATRCNRLEELHVAGQGVLNHQGLWSLARHCGATLRVLHFLETRDAFTNKSLGKVLAMLPQLETLKFGDPIEGDGHVLTPALGVALGKHCTKLTRFECGSSVGSAAILEVMQAVREMC